MFRSIVAGLAAAVVLTVAGAASAQEAVVNGGFESGSLAPFTGGTGYGVAGVPRSGTFGITGFNNTPGGADLTQALSLTAGETYVVSVWARGTNPGNSLTLGLGAQTSASFPLTLTYEQYTFTAVAASANDAVHVIPQTVSGTGNVELDDVSVAPFAAPVTVPTMTEWAMILFGLILAGGAAVTIQRRRFSV